MGEAASVRSVRSSYPRASPFHDLPADDPKEPYYTHLLSYGSFEFGPDWIVVPADHTLFIPYTQSSVMTAYDKDDNKLFLVRARDNVALSDTDPNIQRLDNGIELPAGTFRVRPEFAGRSMFWLKQVKSI